MLWSPSHSILDRYTSIRQHLGTYDLARLYADQLEQLEYSNAEKARIAEARDLDAFLHRQPYPTLQAFGPTLTSSSSSLEHQILVAPAAEHIANTITICECLPEQHTDPMPSRLKLRARTLLARFHPVEHVPPVFNNNVHDLARIGGVSVLDLPHEYTPCDLVIPTRFAACAQHLVDNGLATPRPSIDETGSDETGYPGRSPSRRKPSPEKINIPGLFRIPGSKTTTERLRAYFERQMYDGFSGNNEDFARRSSEIESTVRLAVLPNVNVIPYQIHDVASCFKSFLADLDGGILGSLDIFEGLRKVVMRQKSRKSSESADLDFRCAGPQHHDEEPVDPRHIARILSSIGCAASKNLILAVFGLLAFFMVEDQEHKPSTGIKALDEMKDHCFPAASPMEAKMTAEALGRIFAPLMVSEGAVKDIKMDFSRPINRKTKERRRQSWSPLKSTASSPTKRLSSPNKYVVGKLGRQVSLAKSKTNIHINIHPHPLRSSPYLPLHEAAYASDYDIASPPHSAPLPISNRSSHFHLPISNENKQKFNFPAHSFVREHKNCSAPNLTALSGNVRRHPTIKPAVPLPMSKTQKANKTTALLHDQQARMLLIANVIAVILKNWKAVCRELRAMGWGTEGIQGKWTDGGGYVAKHDVTEWRDRHLLAARGRS